MSDTEKFTASRWVYGMANGMVLITIYLAISLSVRLTLFILHSVFS